jgi:hypothetical protein
MSSVQDLETNGDFSLFSAGGAPVLGLGSDCPRTACAPVGRNVLVKSFGLLINPNSMYIYPIHLGFVKVTENKFQECTKS